MSSLYWPIVDEIRQCIKTEAEELSDSTLMAVHEPMHLRRVAAGDSQGQSVDEWALLDHVIATNRPTPILGQSGFGKSHVIRWLDVQLNRKKSGDDWHVVRIPKNASLKQALSALLYGLDGRVFDDAREKIESVGQGLKTRTVAQHLVVFVGARLEELYDEVEAQIAYSQDKQTELSIEDVRRFKVIRRHAKRSGLPTLIGDPYFSKQLVEKGKCFYQIAKRFTEGSNDQEIEDNRFELEMSDLERNTEPSNLSLEAKTYVRNAQINTSEDARQEAIDLLNECLNDACREAFQQLFQFHSGSFQDLFQDIRRSLKDEGKTLFILVEDMATISAIEDVLIDSLMQEDVRDGQQVLCPLHSAIAVTTGYQGYARRKDTIKTRARYEWYIDKQVGTDEQTLHRIQDFCGRYLNAARHGEEALRDAFRTSGELSNWPGVWISDEKGDEHVADIFGLSPAGIPLFPFNKNALTAMANKYCRPHDSLEFNPRKILQHILREPLEHFRTLYEEGLFPPDGLAEIPCPGNLINDIELNVASDRERSVTLAAIWGHNAESIGELAQLMPAPIASEFGLEDMANVLERTTPSDRKKRTTPDSPKPTTGGADVPKSPIEQELTKEDQYLIPRQVDGYFETKSIPQGVASVIRKALLDAMEGGLKDYESWFGVTNWPKLKVRNIPQIRVPHNPNNPDRPILEFGSETEFSDTTRARKYKRFIVAVLRREDELGKNGKPWHYAEGTEDYSNYRNFLDEWLPVSVGHLANISRESAFHKVEERLTALSVFVPQLAKCSAAEKINYLVITADKIKEQINAKTGLEDWDSVLARYLQDWDDKQDEWLSAFSTNRHGLEGDLIKKSIRGKSDLTVPTIAQRAAQKARIEFMQMFPGLSLLSGCSTRDSYEQSITGLLGLATKLRASGQFKNMEDMTAQKFINRVKKIRENSDWNKIRSGLDLQNPFAAIETIRALQDIDLAETMAVEECLSVWTKYYETNLPRLLNENAEHGADKRKKVEDEFDDLIQNVGVSLQVSEGELP